MDKIVVYTDGSKFPKYDHIGLGAYCKYNGNGYRLSMNVDQQLFVEWTGCTDLVSNPTAELSAAAAVLYEFIHCRVPVHVEIVADYIGVKKWSEGEWEAKKPYIQRLLENINYCIVRISNAGGRVSFRHIRGHQKGDSDDVTGNNESDVMAKSLENINTLKRLIQLINEKDI